MKKTLLLAFFLPFLIQATKAQNSSKTSQTRDVGEFTAVELQMAATVHVTQDNHFSIQVSAPQDVLDKIITEVDDNTLQIYVKQKDWWKLKSDVIVNITMPKPNKLQVEGSGTITAENNFITDFITLQVEGSGKIIMKDYKTQKAKIGVYGSGEILQANAVAEGMVAEVEGSGAIEVSSFTCSLSSISLSGSGNIGIDQLSAESLEADLGGSGVIEIKKGTAAKILTEVNGSGKIIAGDLVGKTVSAKIAGSGNISVGVLDALDASVVGSGNVNYKGNPSNVSKNISGSGSVRSQ